MPATHADPYRLLSLKTTATTEQIREAYKSKVLKCHPDKPGGSAAKFKQVQQAYERLKDPDTRRVIDHEIIQRRDSLRGFSRPQPLEAVSTPVSYSLADGSTYAFEGSPGAHKGRHKPGDVVRDASGSEGVIIGTASNGVYWVKTGTSVATLLYSHNFGGDKDICTVFRDSCAMNQARRSAMEFDRKKRREVLERQRLEQVARKAKCMGSLEVKLRTELVHAENDAFEQLRETINAARARLPKPAVVKLLFHAVPPEPLLKDASPNITITDERRAELSKRLEEVRRQRRELELRHSLRKAEAAAVLEAASS